MGFKLRGTHMTSTLVCVCVFVCVHVCVYVCVCVRVCLCHTHGEHAQRPQRGLGPRGVDEAHDAAGQQRARARAARQPRDERARRQRRAPHHQRQVLAQLWPGERATRIIMQYHLRLVLN